MLDWHVLSVPREETPTLPEAHVLLGLSGIRGLLKQVLDMGMADGHLANLGGIQTHNLGRSSLLLHGAHVGDDWSDLATVCKK